MNKRSMKWQEANFWCLKVTDNHYLEYFNNIQTDVVSFLEF